MDTALIRKTMHTAGFASVLALAAAGMTANAAGNAEADQSAAKQQEAQQAVGAGQAQGQQSTEYGRSEPYEDTGEGQSMLEPQQQAQSRPLSDYNEAMADPNILNATPASLEGQQIIGLDGNAVGTIDDVVRSQDGEQVRLIVSSSDVFGTGQSQAAIPVGMLKVDENQQIVLITQPSEQNIQEMTAGYDQAQFQPIEQEQALGFMPGEATERG